MTPAKMMLLLLLLLFTSRTVPSLAQAVNGTGSSASTTTASGPTQSPFEPPTNSPTVAPTLQAAPTTLPTNTPTETSMAVSPRTSSASSTTRTTFYVIADVPYNDDEREELAVQLQALPSDAEFIVHLGDIKAAKDACDHDSFNQSSSIFQISHAPMFVTPGDNEWNDCEFPNNAWDLWKEYFEWYDLKHWSHGFAVTRQPGRSENFAFVHKGTLFMGLNLVGSTYDSEEEEAEWIERMASQGEWTEELLSLYTGGLSSNKEDWSIGALVLFGHGAPTNLRRVYLRSVKKILKQKLKYQLPAIYINGDKHEWDEESDMFLNVENFKRVQLLGGTSEPILKFTIDTSIATTISNVIAYDRRL